MPSRLMCCTGVPPAAFYGMDDREFYMHLEMRIPFFPGDMLFSYRNILCRFCDSLLLDLLSEISTRYLPTNAIGKCGKFLSFLWVLSLKKSILVFL